MLGRPIDMSPHFFGVKLRTSSQIANGTTMPTTTQLRSNVATVKLIVLQFRADRPVDVSKDDVRAWERRIVNYLRK